MVKKVFSENAIEHFDRSLSYNKDKFEVYLNGFVIISSRGSILILNDKFTHIKTISSNIINSDVPLNYLCDIEILNIYILIIWLVNMGPSNMMVYTLGMVNRLTLTEI
jgi:hypothetical protein